MKKFFILILIVFSSGSAFCQIEDEISAYVNSTEILVINGRKMISKELSDSNITKVKEVYDYLTDLTRTEPYSAFYYLEDLYGFGDF